MEYMIQDYDKPMGVATYKTATDMPERLRKALPDQEELLKIIDRELIQQHITKTTTTAYGIKQQASGKYKTWLISVMGISYSFGLR